MSKPIRIPVIQSLIIEVRGRNVMMDRDLAALFNVSTKSLNQSVRRNMLRFPKDFMFQLTEEEWNFLRSQIVTANDSVAKVRSQPYVFTRNGANMLSSVLNSPIAIQRSIQIIRAFTALEETLSRKKRMSLQSPEILRKLSTHSRAIMRLFKETELNRKQFKIVKNIQQEMIDLVQRMIIVSLREEK